MIPSTVAWGDEEFALINYSVVHSTPKTVSCQRPQPLDTPPDCKLLRGQEPRVHQVTCIFWGAWQLSVPCGVLSTFCLMLLTRPKNNPFKNLPLGGFPGGTVVESLPANAGTRVRALVWGIPHAVEQPGPWATTAEPARLEPVLRNKRGHDSERPAHRDEEWPLLAATRESPRTETKTQHSQK